MSLKLRRGTEAERLTITPELGELIYTTNTKQLYVGDGTTVGGNLVSYNGSVGGNMGSDLVLNGNNITGQGNINISQGTIFSQGNITSGGNIVAQGNVIAQGDVIAQGNIILGVGDDGDTIEFGGVIKSNIIPELNDTYNLGTTDLRWSNFYGNNIYGNITGNVISKIDSSLLVDSDTGVLRGTLEGTVVNIGQVAVQGNVTGNVIGDLTGAVKNSDDTVILSPGDSLTPATFTGNVIGNLSGSVTNGVLTTDFYTDPSWIASLNGSKIFGTIGNSNTLSLPETLGIVDFVGHHYGNFFSFDSTTLVDGEAGVLRGTLIGELDTGNFLITSNNILGSTDENIVVQTQGSGKLVVPGISEFGKIELTSDPETGGILISSSSNSGQPFLLFAAYNDISSSSGDGAAAIYSRARGTPTAPQPLQNGDEIATIVFSALTDISSGPVFSDTANIVVKVDGTVGTGTAPGKLEINIANGAGIPTKRLGIDSSGVLELEQDGSLVAGNGSGEVDISSPVRFIKINVGGVEYAVPAYAINP